MLLDHLIIYRHLTKDADVEKCLSFIEDESLLNEEDFIATMLTLAERYDLHGHLFQSLLTYLLTHHEMVLSGIPLQAKAVDYVRGGKLFYLQPTVL